MREFLFRGKTKSGKWVEGNGIIQGQDTISYSRWVDISNDKERYEVAPETIGQYTDLTDKNGKKIFEGDILQNPKGVVFNKQYKGVVTYSFAFGKYVAAYDDVEFEACDFPYLEVIGNIYDNPELLEGEQ